ncbi:hypothetical protein Q4O60_02015 [Aeribacillus pallidus]|nr:hypothetical protein [Aeribacillus pallidus]
MKKKDRSKYSLADHIFAKTVVSFMCLAIISFPFLVFYFAMHLISWTNDVHIHASGTLSSIKIVLKFFVTTLFITVIMDMIFSAVLNRAKGILGYISEALLMLAFFYLYVFFYSLLSNEIVMTEKGRLYVSLFLFFGYLCIHAVYVVAKRLSKFIVKN